MVGFTVNHVQWDARFPPPYAVVTVALDEDPRVRLTSNIVDVDPAEIRVGMRVVPTFEQRGDVWIPIYVPSAEADGALPDDETHPQDHRRWARPLVGTRRFEDQVAITGVGMSEVGRRLMRPPMSLTLEAVTAAVADAGLEWSDIDGLSTYPGPAVAGGLGSGGIGALEDALGLRPTWYNSSSETFGPAGLLISAMLAVASGLARHVLCFRTVWQATFAAQMRAKSTDGTNPYGTRGARGPLAGYSEPYGIGSPAIPVAMRASHHFARYGTTRETLGWIAVSQRANAAHNPSAVYREPLSMDEYLSARTITTPFGLYDCDVPVDASVAIVVSARQVAGDLARRHVLVEAVGTQMTERTTVDQSTMTHQPHTLGPAAHLWTRTDLRPDDVDVALLYDGFTFNCVSWIESLGFCGIGEAKDFLAGGHNIAREGGIVALNPHGGQLSAGRTHGMGFVHEAVLQLRGEAGLRQVNDARVALATSGGVSPAGAILLRRE